MYRCRDCRLSAKSFVKISVGESDVVGIAVLSVGSKLRSSGAPRQLLQIEWGFLSSHVSYASPHRRPRLRNVPLYLGGQVQLIRHSKQLACQRGLLLAIGSDEPQYVRCVRLDQRQGNEAGLLLQQQ